MLDVLRARPEVAAVGDVRDFVRRPKENGYQSLHAVVALRARGCSRARGRRGNVGRGGGLASARAALARLPGDGGSRPPAEPIIRRKVEG